MKKHITLAAFIFVTVFMFQACTTPQKHTDTKVISINKIIDKNTPNHELCDSLTLTKNDVLKYYSIAEQVSEYEFNDEAIILPCKYQGTISINNDLFQWEIMAGGAGYLYNKKLVNKRYLCKRDCCNILSNLC